MFEVTYLFELFVSAIVGIAIIILGVKLAINAVNISILSEFANSSELLVKILNTAIILAIGAELIKMLCKHTPETVIEVLAFALARQLIVEHSEPWENLITVIAIAVLFAVRRFLLNRYDMVETPDGLVEIEALENEEHEEHEEHEEI